MHRLSSASATSSVPRRAARWSPHLQPPADHERRVLRHFREHARDQGSVVVGLACGRRNRDRNSGAHQLAKHSARLTTGTRCAKRLGRPRCCSRRDRHSRRRRPSAPDTFSAAMPDHARCAHERTRGAARDVAHPCCFRSCPAPSKAEVSRHLGDAAHALPADGRTKWIVWIGASGSLIAANPGRRDAGLRRAVRPNVGDRRAAARLPPRLHRRPQALEQFPAQHGREATPGQLGFRQQTPRLRRARRCSAIARLVVVHSRGGNGTTRPARPAAARLCDRSGRRSGRTAKNRPAVRTRHVVDERPHVGPRCRAREYAATVSSRPRLPVWCSTRTEVSRQLRDRRRSTRVEAALRPWLPPNTSTWPAPRAPRSGARVLRSRRSPTRTVLPTCSARRPRPKLPGKPSSTRSASLASRRFGQASDCVLLVHDERPVQQPAATPTGPDREAAGTSTTLGRCLAHGRARPGPERWRAGTVPSSSVAMPCHARPLTLSHSTGCPRREPAAPRCHAACRARRCRSRGGAVRAPSQAPGTRARRCRRHDQGHVARHSRRPSRDTAERPVSCVS